MFFADCEAVCPETTQSIDEFQCPGQKLTVMRMVQAGRVAGPQGDPRSSAHLDLYCVEDIKGLVRVSDMTTGADGRADVSVSPGRYRAVLRGQGAKDEPSTVEFDVAGSNEIRLIVPE